MPNVVLYSRFISGGSPSIQHESSEPVVASGGQGVVRIDQSPEAESSGYLAPRSRSHITSMDRLSFLISIWREKLGNVVADNLQKSRRNSTNAQQQVAWSKLQQWLNNNPEKRISKQSILEFLISLHSDGLKAVTIRNYASSLAKLLKLGFDTDTNSEEFKDSINSLFLQNPLL